MRNKSGLKQPVRSSTYPCGEWREEEGPQPCPHPVRCQDLQGRGTSASSPSLWGGDWGQLTAPYPQSKKGMSEEAPPHCPILCLQAGASLSAKKEQAWIPRSICYQSRWLKGYDL